MKEQIRLRSIVERPCVPLHHIIPLYVGNIAAILRTIEKKNLIFTSICWNITHHNQNKTNVFMLIIDIYIYIYCRKLKWEIWISLWYTRCICIIPYFIEHVSRKVWGPHWWKYCRPRLIITASQCQVIRSKQSEFVMYIFATETCNMNNLVFNIVCHSEAIYLQEECDCSDPALSI